MAGGGGVTAGRWRGDAGDRVPGPRYPSRPALTRPGCYRLPYPGINLPPTSRNLPPDTTPRGRHHQTALIRTIGNSSSCVRRPVGVLPAAGGPSFVSVLRGQWWLSADLSGHGHEAACRPVSLIRGLPLLTLGSGLVFIPRSIALPS